jgi:protein-S-isoprenylcysteine O-methyltransferase Ste14
MLDSIVKRITTITSQQRSLVFKVLSLIGGGMIFLVLFPFLLGLIGKTAAGRLPAEGSLFLRYTLGIPGITVGLGILLWSVKVFWSAGGGTPAPVAAPQRLVITGPYRYCRNPIQLGAMFLYFGMGAAADSIITGACMLGLALILGTLYHRFIEEKELRRRFGAEYEEYHRRTPFLFPRLRRRASTEDPNR